MAIYPTLFSSSKKGAAVTLSADMAGGSLSAPIQSVGLRSASGAASGAWPSPTSVGNTLVLIVTGFQGMPATLSGWTVVYSGNPNSFQGLFVAYRAATQGESAISFSGWPGPSNWLMLEFPGGASVSVAQGAASMAGNTMSATPTYDAAQYQILALESDATAAYASVAGPATLLYDASATSTNHPGVFFTVTGSGAITATMGAATTLAMYGVINVLSNGRANAVATVTSGTGTVGVSTVTTSNAYAELVIGATLSGSSRIGLASSNSLDFTTLLGVNANGIGYNADGTVKINNANVATIMTYTTGDRIGVAINPILQLIWFRKNGGLWNNSGAADPATNTGGIAYSTVTQGTFLLAWGGSATASVTLKALSSQWVDAAPSGYAQLETYSAPTLSPRPRGTQFDLVWRAVGLVAFTGVNGPRPLPLYMFSSQIYSSARFNRNGVVDGRISGVVMENGTPVANKVVALYDALTRQLISQTTSAGDGTYELESYGRPNVFAAALDPTFQALVYDQLTPG